MYACQNGHIEVVKLLIDKIDINHVGNDGANGFMYACQKGHIEVVKLLIDKNVDINHADKNGMSGFMYACRNGRIEIVKLLAENIEVFNYANKCGVTGFVYACAYGYSDIVKLVIDKDVDIMHTCDDGKNAFIYVCLNGHLEIVKLLIDKNADINHVDNSGMNGFMYACARGHVDIATLLINENIKIDNVNNDGMNEFMLACQGGHLNVDINHVDNSGMSGFMYACQQGHVAIVSMFFEKSETSINSLILRKSVLLALGNGNFNVVQSILSTPVVLLAEPCQYASTSSLIHIPNDNSNYYKDISNIINDDYYHATLYDNHEDRLQLLGGFSSKLKHNDIKISSETENESTINIATFQSCMSHQGAISAICLAAHQFPVLSNVTSQKVYYFEISVLSELATTSRVAAIGVCDPKYFNYGAEQLGAYHSCGYFSDGWFREGYAGMHGPSLYNKGDIIGCGYDYSNQLIFYTKNGEILSGSFFHGVNEECLLPTVSFYQKDLDIVPISVKINFGLEPFAYKGSQVHINPHIAKELKRQEPLSIGSKVIGRYRGYGRWMIGNVVEVLTSDKTQHEHTSMNSKFMVQYNIDSSTSALFDLHEVNGLGNTLLHDCCQKYTEKCLKSIEYLLLQDVDFEAKNKEHRDAFSYLDSRDYLSLVKNVSFDCLSINSYALWFHLLKNAESQISNSIEASQYTEVITAKVQSHPHLIYAKDKLGRVAFEICSKETKKIFSRVISWFDRFEVKPGTRPEHTSATCYVYKALDNENFDENGNPTPVAIKIMRHKDQYMREVDTRSKHFASNHVIEIVYHTPLLGSTNIGSMNDVIDVEVKDNIMTKELVKQFYCIVMPLADKNLYMAVKQERFAGGQQENVVKFVFTQLVQCVQHMHEQGNVIHGDVKPLNIMRAGDVWKLIDLDACSEIGVGYVGMKSSSAYCPPESVYVDAATDKAMIRSPKSLQNEKELWLIAHPSFDVWSLGCILYQLCNRDVKPLFLASNDDNLGDRDRNEEDSLWVLSKWSDDLKQRKLSQIENSTARNLISQMLHKDPLKRPTISKILAHPYLTGKNVSRMFGEQAEYDVFISYRVASDAATVEKLYNTLTDKYGLKVWWDKKCLKDGVEWNMGFCEGLVNSKAFVCIMSKNAINHPEHGRQNLSKLEVNSVCDNVLLEYRLALELKKLGYIGFVFPVLVGEVVTDEVTSNNNSTNHCFNNFFECGGKPNAPNVSVKSVEEELKKHMNNQGLGDPIEHNKTVKSIVDDILVNQGGFVSGYIGSGINEMAHKIHAMVTNAVANDPDHQSSDLTKHLVTSKSNKSIVSMTVNDESKQRIVAFNDQLANLQDIIAKQKDTVNEKDIIIAEKDVIIAEKEKINNKLMSFLTKEIKLTQDQIEGIIFASSSLSS